MNRALYHCYCYSCYVFLSQINLLLVGYLHSTYGRYLLEVPTFKSVLRIRDVCLSRIPDPITATKEEGKKI